MSERMKGRGTPMRVDARYLEYSREAADDGWERPEPERRVQTRVTAEHPRTIITRNRSPDIPFEASINPYRGCEHGCIYCYARPTHAYLDLSPGIDFESRLFAKPDAAALLRHELSRPGYRCTPIALGANTDPYQPIEREWRITRSIIEVLAACNHPLTIVTKSWLVERDLDLLAPMAERGLVKVYVSVTGMDRSLARVLEPRASPPERRIQTLARLHEAGVPAGVLFAPVIPFINDQFLEAVLEACADAGAESAGYVVLRLPLEINQLFRDWLETHYPLKARRVMHAIQDLRDGRDNDAAFFSRQRGTGAFAALLRARFEKAGRRLGFKSDDRMLDTTRFRAPVEGPRQRGLFDEPEDAGG